MTEAQTRRITVIVLLGLAIVAALVVVALPRSPADQSSASPTATAQLTSPSPSTTAASTSATSASTAAATSTASAAPSGGYANPTLGFRVMLPEPYRRSERLSATFPGDKPAAQDAFTGRTSADEDALAQTRCETVCPIWNYVAVVAVYPNEASTGAPREWYSRFSGAVGERFQELTVDGRPAVRVDDGATYPVQYVIRDGARIIRVAYLIYPPDVPAPAGVSRAKLEQIVTSFRFN